MRGDGVGGGGGDAGPSSPGRWPTVVPKHEALVLLIQDSCLSIKEKTLPVKPAGLLEFLRDVA